MPITLPPDYFRNAADTFDRSLNRKQFLKSQILLADRSLLEYKVELNAVAVEMVGLGAILEGQTNELRVVGGVLVAIPVGFTQVVGGLILLSSGFFQKLTAKRNAAQIQELSSIANGYLSDVKLIEGYKTKYDYELKFLNALPYILVAVFLYLILK